MHVIFLIAALLLFWNIFFITTIFAVPMEAGISVAQNMGHSLVLNNNTTSHNLLAMINPRDVHPAAEL
jgi:hypothetical protein